MKNVLVSRREVEVEAEYCPFAAFDSVYSGDVGSYEIE
jgi:hypothetical protein